MGEESNEITKRTSSAADHPRHPADRRGRKRPRRVMTRSRKSRIGAGMCPPHLYLLKPALRRAAPGTFPGIWQVFEGCAGFNTVFRVAESGVVDVAALCAPIQIHRIITSFPAGRRDGKG